MLRSALVSTDFTGTSGTNKEDTTGGSSNNTNLSAHSTDQNKCMYDMMVLGGDAVNGSYSCQNVRLSADSELEIDDDNDWGTID